MTGIVSLKAQRTTTEIATKPVTNININNNIRPTMNNIKPKTKVIDEDVTVIYPDGATQDTATESSLAALSASRESVTDTTTERSIGWPSACATASATDSTPCGQAASLPFQISPENEIKFLKIIIGMMNNNPLIYNGCLLVDDEKLVELLLLVTQADEVQIDADDILEGCFTGRTYRKVHAIYIIKDGETKQLKYDYPELCQELNELKIMWKYVW